MKARHFVPLWGCLSLVSCHQEHAASELTNPLPSLEAIRSRLPPSHVWDHTRGSPRALLQATRLDFPLKESTEVAWDHVDTRGLPPSAVEAWRTNGIRIGVLPHQRRDQFLDDLPAVRHTQHQQIILAEQLAPIQVSPPPSRPTRLKVTAPPMFEPVGRMISGRCQLLARVIDGPGHQASLELVPHHHKPRLTVQTRLPEEKALDGYLFVKLSIPITLPIDGVLVIGLQRSSLNTHTVPTEPASTAPSGSVPEAPDPNSTRLSSETPDAACQVPNHLGRMLLTASRYGKPIQMILLVAVSDY